MTRKINGLRQIAKEFDAVLMDQFGVLHDGVTACEGALQCAEQLRAAGHKIAAVTNSGKRANRNSRRLARFGFREGLFDAVISSGELARDHVEKKIASGALGIGARVAVISRDQDLSTLDGLGLDLSTNLNTLADLVLIAGAEPEKTSLETYLDGLAPSARSGVIAICANPDEWMQTSDGVRFGAGQIADGYTKLGGVVEMLGKPSAQIFQAALSSLGDPEPEKTLMIGDSPTHDIAGAAALGIQTLLVTSGPQSHTEMLCAPDFKIEHMVW